MPKLRFSLKAVDDLTQIWNFTLREWSYNQADIYYNMLLENCNKIASNPKLGKKYSKIQEDLSGLKAGRHIIFYLVNDNTEIEIIRILHDQMDIKDRIRTQ
ncbi:MAG: type II toxin-antitoxin system RelE/ParE family toxin [Bacteroidales bacterium]|nr:type II toxin-antitoxin system RelE/ParE family toxin [Bacteroidales bacterium]